MGKTRHFGTKVTHAVLAVCLAVVLGGLAFALSGASTSGASNSRWVGTGSDNLTTEGGNITSVNIASVSLTDRWAAFYGNVSGTINLTNGVASIYSWTWTATSGGKVCASTGSTVSGSASAATGTDINGFWAFGSAADNATNTFSTANCSMTLTNGVVTNTANVSHKGSSVYQTCAMFIGGTSAKSNMFFCTAINTSGVAFNGQNANYELIVPTNSTAAATETYYFYAEIS